MRSAVAVLTLAGYAAATPHFATLLKRQTISGDATAQVQGLLDLSQRVVADVTAGNVTTACTSWATELGSCESSNPDDQTAVAICSCNANVLEDMSSCASSYGADGTADSDGYNTFCSETLPSITNATTSSAISSAAVSATSAISSLGSAVSSGSSVSSVSSASASAASVSASATTTASTPTILASTGGVVASATPSATSSGTSGAGRLAVGGLAGLLAVGVALLA